METHKGLPLIGFENEKAFETWLDANHETMDSVWIKFAKKKSGIASLTYIQARDLALKYGWIDGLLNKIDDKFYTVRFTRRRPKSTWSKINCELAERFIAEGTLKPAGLREVNAAKADGRWERAYDAPSTIAVPDDLTAELERNPKAKAFFESLKKTNRYSFLYRIQTAKNAEARRRQIARTIEMLEKGEVYK